ncbi:hypothetical protein SC1083_0526 [Aggregatibacter actinomycetemcomitans serotype e str. SC1083]|uniref:Uncharacterized protein n=1 Tax=Aggregatibacter actinomycetemcomitans serotype e str. SC1083 TaxID=907488 RepID=G4A6T6_AGGAC|nr:hypothetical protein SC1083_0526 [Aggregatibacter actinomycetemcomitans serotype e str. SC1083]
MYEIGKSISFNRLNIAFSTDEIKLKVVYTRHQFIFQLHGSKIELE